MNQWKPIACVEVLIRFTPHFLRLQGVTIMIFLRVITGIIAKKLGKHPCLKII